MAEFVDVALSFPTALFSFALVVVVGYWLFVVLGAVGLDLIDLDGGETDAGGLAGFVSGIGLGGVPLTVAVSVLVVVSWFMSLVGAVLIGGLELSTPALIALGLVVLVIAVLIAWAVTSLIVMLVRRTLPQVKESSRSDFVGSTCVVRTPPTGEQVGQAEVTAADGSSAIVAIRQAGNDDLGSGREAVIFDYDAEGEFFWVVRADAALGPDLPHP